MNRMNVNFFICENSLFVLFGAYILVFDFFFPPLHLLGERAMAAMGAGCKGALSVSGLEVMPGSHSLVHSVSHILSFLSKLGSFMLSQP